MGPHLQLQVQNKQWCHPSYTDMIPEGPSFLLRRRKLQRCHPKTLELKRSKRPKPLSLHTHLLSQWGSPLHPLGVPVLLLMTSPLQQRNHPVKARGAPLLLLRLLPLPKRARPPSIPQVPQPHPPLKMGLLLGPTTSTSHQNLLMYLQGNRATYNLNINLSQSTAPILEQKRSAQIQQHRPCLSPLHL